MMEDGKNLKFYSIDDRLLLRWGGPRTIPEHYTEEGWKIWTNSQRFFTEAEEIDEDSARELLARRKKRLAELHKAA